MVEINPQIWQGNQESSLCLSFVVGFTCIQSISSPAPQSYLNTEPRENGTPKSDLPNLWQCRTLAGPIPILLYCPVLREPVPCSLVYLCFLATRTASDSRLQVHERKFRRPRFLGFPPNAGTLEDFTTGVLWLQGFLNGNRVYRVPQ